MSSRDSRPERGGGSSRRPPGRGDAESRAARARVLRWAAIVYCSVVAVAAFVVWRRTGWPLFPFAAAAAVAVALVLLRRV